VSWARRQRDLEPAGDVFETGVMVGHQQGEDAPLVLLCEIGVFDQRAPSCLNLEEAFAQNLEPAISFQEQSALAFDDARAGEVCELGFDASAQLCVDWFGAEVDAFHASVSLALARRAPAASR